MQAVSSVLIGRSFHAALVIVVSLTAGCGGPGVKDGPPPGSPSLGHIPDAVPKAEPRSPYGNPSSYVVHGNRYHTLGSSRGYVERGIASWYGRKFHGRRTSSGESFDMYAMTAAHRSLPLPTYVLVTNLENGRRAVVRVNDRGPFHPNRLIDLSYAAASKLGIVGNGTGFVEVRAVGPGTRPVEPSTVTRTVAATPDQAARPAEPVQATNGTSAPPPAEPPAQSVRLYLQAGAFSDRLNAERLSQRLWPVAGKLVYVSPIVVDGTALYRVRIGPIPDVVKADQLTNRITAMDMEVPRIVLE
jgi:rare lipoprotein A